MPATPKHLAHDQQDWMHLLERLHESAVAVAASHDEMTALQTIVDAARDITAAEFGALGVPGQPGEPMARFVVSGVPPEVLARAGRPPMGRGVLGLILSRGQSLRLSNLADHLAYQGYPSTHPRIVTFLGVPVRMGGEIVGDLYLGNKRGGGDFSQTDQRVIEMLAAHAGAVIQSLRHQQEVAELARLREHEALGRELQDNVLQTLYGSGLLLSDIDLDDKMAAATRLKGVVASLGLAVDYLQGHLVRLSTPPKE